MSAELPIGTMFVADDADEEPTVWVQTDMPDRPHPLLLKSEIRNSAFQRGGSHVMDAAERLWNGIVEWVEPRTTILELKKPSAEERERALGLAESMVDRMIDKPTDGQPAYVRLEDRLKLVLDAAAFLLGESR